MTYCDKCNHLYDTDFHTECPLCDEPFGTEEDTVLKHPNLTRDDLKAQGATFRGDVALLPDGRKYVPAHSREITNEWSRWS